MLRWKLRFDEECERLEPPLLGGGGGRGDAGIPEEADVEEPADGCCSMSRLRLLLLACADLPLAFGASPPPPPPIGAECMEECVPSVETIDPELLLPRDGSDRLLVLLSPREEDEAFALIVGMLPGLELLLRLSWYVLPRPEADRSLPPPPLLLLLRLTDDEAMLERLRLKRAKSSVVAGLETAGRTPPEPVASDDFSG